MNSSLLRKRLSAFPNLNWNFQTEPIAWLAKRWTSIYVIRWRWNTAKMKKYIHLRNPEHRRVSKCQLLGVFVKVGLHRHTLSDEEDGASSAATTTENSEGCKSPKSPKDSYSISNLSEQEKYWRENACDYETRYCGHCNTTTDIKEANFFGRFVSDTRLNFSESNNPLITAKDSILSPARMMALSSYGTDTRLTLYGCWRAMSPS